MLKVLGATMRMGVPADERVLAEQFAKYDRDADGTIDAEELAELLAEASGGGGGGGGARAPSDAELRATLAASGATGSSITYAEFREIHRKAKSGELDGAQAALLPPMLRFEEPLGVGAVGDEA